MINKLLNKFLEKNIVEPDLVERYLFAIYFVKQYFSESIPSILDVGGIIKSRESSPVIPLELFFEKIISIDIKKTKNLKKYIIGDGRKLPFKDNSFNIVISLDVLEHIPSNNRETFIRELDRVAKDIVFLSFPFKSPINDKFDKSLYNFIKLSLGEEFKELKEHIENGLPKVDEIANQKLRSSDKWIGYGGSINNFLHFFFFRYYFYRLRDQQRLNIFEKLFLQSFYIKNIDQAPFYRAFVAMNKDKKDQTFNKKAKNIFDNFVSLMKSLKFEYINEKELNNLIENYGYLLTQYRNKNRKKIAVILFYESIFDNKILREVFQHLVSQELYEEEYEIIILFSNENNISQYEKDFPQIKFVYFNFYKELILTRILSISNADFFYFISENNITYAKSIKKFVDLLSNSNKSFIKFTYNSKGEKIESIKTHKLRLLNSFVKRELFRYVKKNQGVNFITEFNREISGYQINNYKLYFSLLLRNKKITFATHLYSPAKGGAENLAKSLAETLANNDYKVKVITTQAYSTEAFFLKDKRRIEKNRKEENEVKIERKNFSRKCRLLLNLLSKIAVRVNYPYSNFLKLFRFGPRSKDYYKALLSEEPDLIITTPFPMFNNYYAYKAATNLKKPLITIPCFHIIDKCSFRNPILFKILHNSKMIIALTSFEKEYFVRELGIKEDKILVIPPSLDLDKKVVTNDKYKIRKEYGIKERNVILYLGQHGMHKNIMNIILSMKYIWTKIPDTALVIAGGITDYTKKLKEQAKKLEIKFGKKIYFFDNFEENIKDEIFQMSDVFISLSEYESFGIVFIEAMKNELPIIGSVKSVARTIIDEFQNGFLVNPSNLTEVAGSIIELLEDKNIRKKYVENSIKKVKNIYDKRIIKENILGVIEYVINRSSGRIY